MDEFNTAEPLPMPPAAKIAASPERTEAGIVWAALGIAFAAFCVWLIVRIVNRRERWAKWTLAAMLIGLPVLYVASFGPACWWTHRPEVQAIAGIGGPFKLAPQIYWPIGWLASHGPQSVTSGIYWYAEVGTGCSVLLPVESSGMKWDAGH